jgi:hypothetical protein
MAKEASGFGASVTVRDIKGPFRVKIKPPFLGVVVDYIPGLFKMV